MKSPRSIAASKGKKIRVGLIRCDTHGMWFGPLMENHDPVLLQRPMPFDPRATYSWQRGIVHYYFYSHYRFPLQMTSRKVAGFTITRLWDEDRASAELAARVFHGRPKVCDTFEEVSDDVDMVLISDCNGDGSDHLRLARPGLEKGVAAFIDKPMALTTKDAVELVRLSRKHKAPILSASIYQADPKTIAFAKRLPEVGRLSLATIQCSATHQAATIGAVCAAQSIFGTGIKRVSCLRVPERYVAIHLDYDGQKDRPSDGIVVNTNDFNNPFPNPTKFSRTFAAAYGNEAAIQGTILDGYSAADGASVLLERARDMVRQRRSDTRMLPEMVKAVAVCEAIRKSLQRGKPMTVDYPES